MKIYTITNRKENRYIIVCLNAPIHEATQALMEHIDPTMGIEEDYAHRDRSGLLLDDLNDVARSMGIGCKIRFHFTD